ncbi:MAG: helix-turn-helix transcriptional regulator [Gemmataceae bacterium]|nr:helix-turn-helix transcriptional regulator [Gemmataceae bacterium]
MQQRKKQKSHGEVVRLFSSRLREVRLSRGMTQAELAHSAQVSEAYVGRLERGEAAPGIELVLRMAESLGVVPADLLPTRTSEGESHDQLRQQAKNLFATLLDRADREAFTLLCPFLRLLLDRTK